MPSSIYFFKEDIKFRFSEATRITRWINAVIKKEGFKSGDINFIFCSDKYLLNLNQEYLNHNYYTDIITFDNTVEKVVSGEIYISIDRVKNNAETLGTMFHVELKRVIIHGILHLMGYQDSTIAKKKSMRLKEDACLSLLSSFT